MGSIRAEDLLQTFCDDYSELAARASDEYGCPYIRIEKPIALPVFAAFCSGNGREVFLRGCTRNFQHTFPSLFRGIPNEDVQARWEDYKCLLRELGAATTGLRWNRPNLGAVLQHYGMKTPWLDVVRSFYTAVWFATHDLVQQPCSRHESIEDSCPGCGARGFVKPSCRDYGWISFYATEAVHSNEQPGFNEELVVQDIPCEQSSKHFRPHAQQGLSLAMQDDSRDWHDTAMPGTGRDFNSYRIAHLRFPNNVEWAVCGGMFSTGFLFPPRSQDETLDQLLDEEVGRVLSEFEFRLGRVTDYSLE